MSRPSKATPEAIASLAEALKTGYALREASTGAGIHVSTVCRWALRDLAIAKVLAESAAAGQRLKYRSRPSGKPRVPVHPFCPACGEVAEIRRVYGYAWPFWRCRQWPSCEWSSWRPRHPEDCTVCHSPRFWSHSRKSVVCTGCQTRTTPH